MPLRAHRSVASAAALSLPLLALIWPSLAGAQTPALDATREMHTYFAGEKREGIFFLSAGIASLGGGTALVLVGTDRSRAASGPLFGIGLVQVIAGFAVYFRTDAQVAALDAQMRRDPAGYVRNEHTRMLRVNAQFRLLEGVETAIALGGAATAFVGAATHTEIAVGLGAGFMLEGALMLALDLFAHQRGRRYQQSLETFAPSVLVSPLADGLQLIGSLRF